MNIPVKMPNTIKIGDKIIPIIVLNLIIGFQPNSGIDNWAHIGGLVGGVLAMMAVGVEKKSSTTERVNMSSFVR